MTSLAGMRALSITCGLLMAAAAAIGAHGPAFVAMTMVVMAAAVVAAATVFRPAATLAVLLAASAIVLWNPAPTLAAVTGLAAALYLMLWHAATAGAGPETISGPTVFGAAGFTVVGLVATAFPLQLPLLPLAAPLAVLAIYALVMRPFTDDREG
jgi:hypothetical protein